MAAGSENWVQCKDKYLEAYGSCSADWHLRFCCLSGYSSVLLEGSAEASAADLKMLKQVAEGHRSKGGGPSSKLERVLALYTLGYIRFQKGEREGAARRYRTAVEVASSATPAERECFVELAKSSQDMPWALPSVPCGPIFDHFEKQARDNLAPMEMRRGQHTNVHPGGATGATGVFRKYSMPFGPLATRAIKEDVNRRLGVGGSACDACGKRPTGGPEEAPPRLKRCGRCKAAYYCNATCAKAAWRAGHKRACREPGQIEIGDIVLVKMPDGDQSASHGSAAAVDEEYIAVEVRAAVSGEQARWSVGVIGATPGSASFNVSAADVMSIRPAA